MLKPKIVLPGYRILVDGNLEQGYATLPILSHLQQFLDRLPNINQIVISVKTPDGKKTSSYRWDLTKPRSRRPSAEQIQKRFEALARELGLSKPTTEQPAAK